MLDGCIIEAGLDRADLWISNAIRCRPAKLVMTPRGEVWKNRVPTEHEIDCCHGYLDEELKALRPKVIVCMGAEAAMTVFSGRLPGGVLENQGKVQWSDVYNCWIITTVHPSYLLHKPGDRELLVWDLAKAARWAVRPQIPEPVSYQSIESVEQMRELVEYLLNSTEIAFDWETNGIHPKKSIGICCSFSCKERESYVVARYGAGMSDIWSHRELQEIDGCLREIFLSDVPKLGSNVPFDVTISQTTLDVITRNVSFDCANAMHCINNHLGQRGTSLKLMADLFTDMGRYDDPMDKWLIQNHYVTDDGKPDMGKLWLAPNELVWYYNCCDSDATIRVAHVLAPKLVEEGVDGVFRNERLPLALEHRAIDRIGVRINVSYAQNLAGQLTDALAAAQNRVVEVVGEEIINRVKGKSDFNLNSYPQVGKLLFEEMGVPILGYTESGNPSTREEYLLPLRDLHEIVPTLLMHRAYTKLKGYVDGTKGDKGILAVVDEDGYARTNTIIPATETFRLVTRRPFALYTWPKTAPGMPSVRAMIIPRDGYKMVARDYIQQEFVIQACAAGQEDLIEAMLVRREDIHERVMADLFHKVKADYFDAQGNPFSVDLGREYKVLRSKTKSLNFKILFRGGAESLAKSLSIDKSEAQNYIDAYGERYDKIRWWQYQKIKEVRETGRSLGLFTTYRKLWAIYSYDKWQRFEAERQACNFPIQNGGAHVLARALLRIIRWIRDHNYPARVLFAMHDQILTECREDLAEEWDAKLGELMEEPQPELGGRSPRTDSEISDCWAG